MPPDAGANQQNFSGNSAELEGNWFAETAQCAKHPQSSAERTCARCGAFCCEACLTQAWCEPCALVVMNGHVPETAKSVAWKLLLAPVVFLASSAWWMAHGNEVPLLSYGWVVPLVCTVIVLRRHSPAAAWIGAVTSLLLLAWQGLTLFSGGAELRLLDVALLAIAPVLALDGASRLSRLFARVQVLRSA